MSCSVISSPDELLYCYALEVLNIGWYIVCLLLRLGV